MRSENRQRVLVACAGWSLSSGVAADFPAEGSHLQRYAAVMPAVEINSSFYRPHQPATYARWRDSVPEDFRFSVKMPRTISHERRLRDTEESLDRFLAEAGNLQHKLGCLLLQFPPSLRFDAEEAGAFFALLRDRTAIAVACEPRHASWFSEEASVLLQQYAIAFVHADPLPVRGGVAPDLPGIAYLRLHGSPEMYRSSYERAFLEALARRIDVLRGEADRIWCVFDNTANGHALPNALALMSLLSARDLSSK